jgi:hypothetical protein
MEISNTYYCSECGDVAFYCVGEEEQNLLVDKIICKSCKSNLVSSGEIEE